MPFESDLIKIRGTFISGNALPLDENSLKLPSLRGEVILESSEGAVGAFGNYTFMYQYIDLNVIGLKDGITAIVHLIGKGRFHGAVYGYRIEGISEGDELIGVPPIRGNKAKVNVEGLWIEKNLPKPRDLRSYDFPLPYTVVGFEKGCKKVVLFDNMDVLRPDGKIRKLEKGTHELCGNWILYYKGFVEQPERVVYVKQSDIVKTVVSKFENKGSYMYLRTPMKTIILNDSVKTSMPLDAYCKEGRTEVEITDNEVRVSQDGITIRRKVSDTPSSCEVLGNDVILALPSRPITNLLRITDNGSIFIPSFSLSHVEPPEWEEEWGSGETAKLLSFARGKSIELEPGIFKLLKLRRHNLLLAYNLYGSLYLLDEGLNVVWSREAHAVRSAVETSEGFAVWIQRPPRIRFFKVSNRGVKEIGKVKYGMDHVALCSDDERVYAVDEAGVLTAFDSRGRRLLRGKVEPAWACMSSGDTLALLNKDGLSKWKLLSSVKDWKRLYHIALLQGLSA